MSDDEGVKGLLEGIGQVVVPQQYVERAKQAESLNLTFGIRPPHLEDVNLIQTEDQTGSVIDAQVVEGPCEDESEASACSPGGIRSHQLKPRQWAARSTNSSTVALPLTSMIGSCKAAACLVTSSV
jgi:hypothetical protein